MKERSASVHPPVGAGVGVGIDFGTTNSAVSVARADGTVDIVRFPAFGDVLPYFRSVVFFEPPEPGRAVPGVRAGPDAMAHSIAGDEGRLMQSLKSFLPSKLVTRTQVYSRAYALEEIIGAFLKRLRAAAEQVVGPLGDRAVVGRPVRFVKDAEDDDHPDALAIERLRRAFALAGFTDVTLAMEPVAAALAYQAGLRSAGDVRAHRVLVGDFGGGTSDFTVMEGRAVRGGVLSTVWRGPSPETVFDARIVPIGSVRAAPSAPRQPLPPRGFWRVDKTHRGARAGSTRTSSDGTICRFLREDRGRCTCCVRSWRGSGRPRRPIRIADGARARETWDFKLYRGRRAGTKVALSARRAGVVRILRTARWDIRETVDAWGSFEGVDRPRKLAQIAHRHRRGAHPAAGCVPEDIGRGLPHRGETALRARRPDDCSRARFRPPSALSGGNETDECRVRSSPNSPRAEGGPVRTPVALSQGRGGAVAGARA
jgi:hypothetical protein